MRVSDICSRWMRAIFASILCVVVAISGVPVEGIALAIGEVENSAMDALDEAVDADKSMPSGDVDGKALPNALGLGTSGVAGSASAGTDDSILPVVKTDESLASVTEEPRHVIVRFDANGGTGEMTDADVVLDGSVWALPTGTFSRDGYRFVGWATTSDGKDVQDVPETDVNEGMVGICVSEHQEVVDLRFSESLEDGTRVECDLGSCVRDGALKLYAQWEKVETSQGADKETVPVTNADESMTMDSDSGAVNTSAVSTGTEQGGEEKSRDVASADETKMDTIVSINNDGKDDTNNEDKDNTISATGVTNGDVGLDAREHEESPMLGDVFDKVANPVSSGVKMSPFVRKFAAPLAAPAMGSLTMQSAPTGSRAGTAYAVLDSAGTLTFFRSTNSYTAGTGQTVTDIMGSSYTGQVYTGVETYTGTSSSSLPWYSQRTSVKLARVADGQVISPVSCAYWFYGCKNMTAFEGAERLDTGAVTSMYRMFYNCSSMTETPAVDNWDISNVTTMSGLFYSCSKLTETPSVGSWNTSAVTNISRMFSGCTKLTNPPAVGSWDTSKVTDMGNMFYNCVAMTEPPAVGNWSTSAVADMSGMFYYCSKLTEPPSVGGWNTSAVTSMSSMFYRCSAMTVPPAVSGWNTVNVTNMSSMFSYCSAMTEPPAVGSWNTSNVANMTSMFSNCSAMREPPSVGNWSTSAVTDMSSMFNNCSSMTEPPLVSSWNTGAVTYMTNMFAYCSSMTEPPLVGSWNTGAVNYMNSMFSNCSSMTEPPAVGSWDTSAVTYMDRMFQNCSSMTEPPAVGRWNTSRVTRMDHMFDSCSAMTEPPAVNDWNTSAVTEMSSMFQNCSSMTMPPAVGSWDTSELGYIGSMFSNCSSMTEPPSVSGWNTSAVINMSYMFDGCSKMTSLDVSSWDFSNATGLWYYLGLQNCSALKELKVPAGAKILGLPEHDAQNGYAATWRNAERGITGSTAANLVNTVNAGNGAGTWTWEQEKLAPTSGTAYAVLDSAGTLTLFRSTNSYTAGENQTVTDIMGNMYTGQVYTGVENTGTSYNSAPWYNQCSSVKFARIADGQVIVPKSCAYWFYECSNMTAFEGTERLDTSMVIKMSNMFYGCRSMTVPPAVGNWDTSAVTNMNGVFRYCSSMMEPPAVGSWNTSSVTNMNYMFEECSAMTVPPAVGSWNISSVTELCGMFRDCSSMTEPPAVGSWNTSNVTRLDNMFHKCSAMTIPPAVGSWDTSKVTRLGSMFYRCSAMTEPPAVGGWNTGAVTDMSDMFRSCAEMLSLDVSGWDFSKVTSSSYYLGLRDCPALRELKVPAGAKIKNLPEHEAQVPYFATWCNVERGITGSTAAALMETVNAGNGAGTWKWEREIGPRDGTAYAVLDSAGTLTFFRSENNYTAGDNQTVTDIRGNTYTGEVYTGVENTGTSISSAPWRGQNWYVNLARIADGQVIAPQSCAGWFYGGSNMTAFEGAERLDTSNVTSMTGMFRSCSAMTETPLVGGWNTSKVTDMSYMFSNCTAMVTPPVVDSWDTSEVTNMNGMFEACSKITEPPAVGSWNTSKVTDMSGMFGGCVAITESPAVGSWDTSAVTNMHGMFSDCRSIVTPPAVGNWSTGAVTDMSGMFSNCHNMTEPPAVGSWDTSAVTTMREMFSNCHNMTEPPAVGDWNTSAVTNLQRMFYRCWSIATPPAVGSWNTGAVTDMYKMFESCLELLSLDVSGWDFSQITKSSRYLGLKECSALRELKVPAGAKIADLPEHEAQGKYFSTWGNVERSITGSTAAALMETVNAGNGAGTWKWEREIGPRDGTAYAVLDSAGTLTFFRSENNYTAGENQTVTDIRGNTYTGQVYTDVENTGTSSSPVPWRSENRYVNLARIADGQVISPASCAGWFDYCSNMTAFEGAERLDTSAVTSMYEMFHGCTSMTASPVVGNWDTSAVTNMSRMFSNCTAMVTSPVVNDWDTSKVTNMSGLFEACTKITEPPAVGSWNTSKVTDMSGMFGGCWSITEPPVVDSWDTSAVTNMSSMFSECRSIVTPPAVGNWNTGAVTDMSYMFERCYDLTEPPAVGSWDTRAVTTMREMFYNCYAMTEPPAVGDWNTSAVTNLQRMFSKCWSITTPPAVCSWNTGAVTEMYEMFSGCSELLSLDVSGWDFSKITKSSRYLGLQECSALRELKVPAGAKIAGLPEHEAQGNYAATWGNAERSITGSTAASLMSIVNAGNGAGTWTWDLAGYTVDFMIDGSSTAMSSEQVKADEAWTVSNCEVTKLYHDFVEWSGSDGKTYHAGDTISAGTFAAGDKLTLTAVFEAHEYGPGEIDGNMQITVPTSINYVVDADGTLTGPTNAKIENNSPFGTCVSSVEVKSANGFTFVKDTVSTDVDNAVALSFGTAGDVFDAVDCLTKRPVGNQDAWAMGMADDQAFVNLSTSGRVRNVSADIGEPKLFGEIRWFVKVSD